MSKPQIVRHGEVILKPDTLPKEAKLVKETDKYIVAHSETGHHHVLEATDLSKFKVYTWNGETYLELKETATLLHEKTGKEVHTPHVIQPSVYKVIIKKAYDYFAKKMSQVRD